ncbi:MAG: SsrA-binding protein SmpB [Verrucomicrobiota bacterium]|nr:SsrA-binding protein SmpB [Verrucomicrobiota bacterium]
MSAAPKQTDRYKEIRNSKVLRDYFVEDTLEAGIVLTGSEIKSVREGGAQISDSFVRFDRGLPVMYHGHIPPYSHTAKSTTYNPYRPRKLLIKKQQALKWEIQLESAGLTIIPLRMYFKKALLKVEIGLCKGKKQYDKRDDLKKKAARRDEERHVRIK